MQTVKKLQNHQCLHSKAKQAEGLALITIGNTLRSDDGAASYLCDALSAHVLNGVCRFDLGSYTGFLADCLAGHKAAIIIDSTSNGNRPGTVSIIDLGAMVSKSTPMNISSCHGFSLADELRLAEKHNKLPKRIIFFGVEISKADWNEHLSNALKDTIPVLVSNLSLLITKVVETLKQNA